VWEVESGNLLQRKELRSSPIGNRRDPAVF